MPFAVAFLTAALAFPDCPCRSKVVPAADPSAVIRSLRDPPLDHIYIPVADLLLPQDHEGVVKDEYTHLKLLARHGLKGQFP